MCSLSLLLPLILWSLRYSNAADDWDYIIFTQSWPLTVCKIWMEHNPTRSCSFPEKVHSWSIHGIWPTKTGSMGPEFCNKTWSFDPEEVQPLIPELSNDWTNVLQDSNSTVYDLWAHEWDKHGTCGASIESLDCQTKYFSQGIEWLQNYTMTTILSEANIIPSDTITYTTHEIFHAIKNKLGVNPAIICLVINGQQHLVELRICFSKSLELIDCEFKKYVRDIDEVEIISNCNSTGIVYNGHEGGTPYTELTAQVAANLPSTL